MITLANGLAGKMFEVSIVVNKANGPLISRLDSKVPTIDLNCARERDSVFALRRFLRTQGNSILITGTPPLNLQASLATLGMKRHVKLILTERMELTTFLRNNPSPFARYLPLIYRRANYVVILSEFMRDVTRKKLMVKRKKIKHIPNGFDFDSLDEMASKPFSYPWLQSKDNFVIVSVARLVSVKNHHLLVSALARSKVEPLPKLILIGVGPEEESIRSHAIELKISSSVYFMGELENPYPFIKRADLLCVSSNSESFSRVVVESVALQTPVVATDCGGPSEILEDVKFGTIVPVGDVESFSSAIRAAVLNPQKIDPDELNSFKSKYAAKNIVKRYIDLFSELSFMHQKGMQE